jgi:uncharacterized protein
MPTAALGIMCKAPRTGAVKTRLARLLGAENAAALSACFLRDVAAAIEEVPCAIGRKGYAVYAPAGTETELMEIVPPSFGLVLQADRNFGVVLLSAARHLLQDGHDCAILINSDSPTLPSSLLRQAIEALRGGGDRVVLGPASDGGYYLIGLKTAHPNLFRDIAWSTADVLRQTLGRAQEIGLPAIMLPEWYDVDDAATFACLQAELAGRAPPFAAPGLSGGRAEATRRFLAALDGVALERA